MSELPTEPNSVHLTKEQLKEKGRELSECMLSSYWGTTAGLALGVFFGRQKKSLRPFVFWVAVGSVAEFAYGYYNKCRVMREEFKEAKKAIDELEKNAKVIVDEAMKGK